MRFDVITLFPAMFAAVTEHGVTGRAMERGLASVAYWNPRDYTQDRYRRVDERPYGGGPGMVMTPQPLCDAIAAARAAAPTPTRVIVLSPAGRALNQGMVRAIAQEPRLVLVAGRYEGIDERVLDAQVDEEWSIGDYVLSGGELAAMVVIDAVVRLLPGVLGDECSAQQDSFMEGLLDYPHYTRPEVYAGREVPAVLRSGDHGAVARWRLKQSLGRTWQRRPDLLMQRGMSPQTPALGIEQRRLLAEYIAEFKAREQGLDPADTVDEGGV